MAGHCMRHGDLPANRLVLWEPDQGRASCEGKMLTYIDSLKRNTGLASSKDLKACIMDRIVWLEEARNDDDDDDNDDELGDEGY